MTKITNHSKATEYHSQGITIQNRFKHHLHALHWSTSSKTNTITTAPFHISKFIFTGRVLKINWTELIRKGNRDPFQYWFFIRSCFLFFTWKSIQWWHSLLVSRGQAMVIKKTGLSFNPWSSVPTSFLIPTKIF